MRAQDAIEIFFATPCDVKRKLGEGPEGPTFESVTQVNFLVNETPRQIRLPNNTLTVPAAALGYSINEREIPLGSLVTIPGKREAQVIQSARADVPLDVPNHQVVYLG